MTGNQLSYTEIAILKMTTSPNDQFLTIKELSKWIRLSESHLYCLVSKKKIPYIKLGGKLLFSTSKITEWIEFSSRGMIIPKSRKRS